MIIEMRFLYDDHSVAAQVMGPGEIEDIEDFAKLFERACKRVPVAEEVYIPPPLPPFTVRVNDGTGLGEPFYVPGTEDVKPVVDLGEPVQVEDDLRFNEVEARDEWTEEHEERAGIIATNGNDGDHYIQDLTKIIEENITPYSDLYKSWMASSDKGSAIVGENPLPNQGAKFYGYNGEDD